jgi:hypothetical protein
MNNEPPKKTDAIDKEQQIEALEKRIIWALNFLRAPGSGVVADHNFKTLGHWTHWFADALEMGGRYKVDRELLGLSRREAEKVLKARELAKTAQPETQSCK